jgi:undecaprenyl-diphosphatase
MDTLLALDRQLFYLINHLPHNGLTDSLALMLSGIGIYGFVFIGIIFLFFIREERKNLRFFRMILVIAVLLLFLEQSLKLFFVRLRPDNLVDTIYLGRQLSDYSFPSGHAMTAFAAAYVLVKEEPRSKIGFYVFAALIALSRGFLGRHFPSDILAGSILGTFIGFMLWHVKTPANRRLPHTVVTGRIDQSPQ